MSLEKSDKNKNFQKTEIVKLSNLSTFLKKIQKMQTQFSTLTKELNTLNLQIFDIDNENYRLVAKMKELEMIMNETTEKNHELKKKCFFC